MLNKAIIKAETGYTMYNRGKQLYYQHHVKGMQIRRNDDNKTIEVHADVLSSGENYDYDVNITLSYSGDWILDSTCDCPYYEDRYTPCKHIAAVLIACSMEDIPLSDTNRNPVSVISSDREIRNLLNEMQYTAAPAGTYDDTVQLIPYISFDETSSSLQVSFKLGRPGAHQYVLQNISRFLSSIKNQDSVSYGKELSFIHQLSAFDSSSRRIVEFLLSLSTEEDHYASRTSYYQYYPMSAPVMDKTLSLKGRYLDDFMNIVSDQRLTDDSSMTAYVIKDEIPAPEISIRKSLNGYSLTSPSYELAEGAQYIYLAFPEKHTIYRLDKHTKLLPLFRYFHKTSGTENFIADADLPAFSKRVYPLIAASMQINNPDGFDPLDYAAEKPAFKIYLDLPQNDLITGSLFAVYGDQEYNLLDKVQEEGRRDLDEENRMNSMMTAMFNSFDPREKLLCLTGNDAMYRFIYEGIPRLQENATVFISDALKKLTIRPVGKITVGISVTHNNLLNLELVPENMSLTELSEILSRYDRKKKYYRLKTGEFVEMDDTINDLMDLKDRLNLSKKEIETGETSLARYRAMYLDGLSTHASFDLDEDVSFRHMIQKMKTIDQTSYDPPQDLKAELRPYQLDGFRWLCALKDNGFGALLADEMGLGKTLQIITFLGAWKERNRVLIVCPASLVYNWYYEIQRFLPSMHAVMIQGPQTIRNELIRTSADNDVLITSYDLLRRDIETYQEMQFSCEVIDEAQFIKNANTQASRAVKNINSSFRIALTGTPIENKLSELWSIFDYLMPGFLHGYEKFKRDFESPIVRDNDEYAQEELIAMISPFILRRLKKDVLKDLPDKLEEVYYAPLEGEQKDLYNANVQKIKLQVEKQTDQEFHDNKMMILQELTRLRQICCNPSLYYKDYKANSAKEDLCIERIVSAVESGHKILLFSQFTSMLDLLMKRLDKEKISYHLLTGSTPKQKRAEMVEAFQHDDIPVFCISLKAGGTGLNLTAADIVIHYDPWWNTAVENQASDRAHRIGQTHVVTVYKLIMKDTIEERILALQQEKSGLAERILSGESISSASLTREDLLALL